MQGKVVWIDSKNKERIKVKFNIDHVATIDLLGDEANINDILEGNFTNLGGEKLRNKTQNKEINVYIQDFN